jgi:TrmH family RNA methyltransferase
VGAVARVVRNTGLHALTLVAPGDYRTVECWRSAWGAQEVLEGARVVDALDEATGDAAYVAAFSGRRDGPSPPIDVREAAAEMAALHHDDIATLVFGPETTGLSHGEIASCGRRVLIPTHPGQPSLNLSHAVAIAGYEALRALSRAPAGPRRARHEDKEEMLQLLREGLLAIGALRPRNADGYFLGWRALFARADLTPKEVRLLSHMARKMLACRRPHAGSEGPARG